MSDSADLARLGFTDRHLRLALGETARAVLAAKASLVYGGHLAPTGYTAFLETELDRYGRSDEPLRLYLAWSEHRRIALSDLGAARRRLGLGGRFTYLDSAGEPIDPQFGRGEEPVPVSAEEHAASLTGLRRCLTEVTDARVFIGGKETGFKGRMPGVVEEALFSVRAGQPIYLAGGFGGATASLAQALLPSKVRYPERLSGDQIDPQTRSALEEIRSCAEENGWEPTSNGLTDADNNILAVTYRPSEVARLLSIGLGRVFGAV